MLLHALHPSGAPVQPAAMIDDSLETYRDVIVRNFPDLARSRFELTTAGWHSIAVDVDDRLIFKFPRHEVAERALQREAALLAAIRPRTGMPVPDLTIHDGPPTFSRHEKLKGDHRSEEHTSELQSRENLVC